MSGQKATFQIFLSYKHRVDVICPAGVRSKTDWVAFLNDRFTYAIDLKGAFPSLRLSSYKLHLKFQHAIKRALPKLLIADPDIPNGELGV